MLLELFHTGIFRLCHASQLVYNTCWEDPRLDRVALQIGPSDRVLVITSGGCNALDYLLENPQHVHAVDVNWRQNALLELKVAAIRALPHELFFELFGQGRLPNWDDVYPQQLRHQLSERARGYWDNRGWMFCSRRRRGSFYFRGSSGFFAWLINVYIDHVARFRDDVESIFHAQTLEQQREIYQSRIKPQLWGPFIRWVTRRDTALAMLGVPRAQRRQIDAQYPGGISRFIEDHLDELFTQVPLCDNYFWRVYATGAYTRDCCPEYLKPENFARLQEGLVDRVSTHTCTLLEFLHQATEPISRYVLLDHMDWLYERHQQVLREQWQAICDRSAEHTRIIWRSAAPQVDFVDPLVVRRAGRTVHVGDLLQYDHELARQLHPRDRVHTYGSLYVAALKGGSAASTGLAAEEADEHEHPGHTQNAVSPQLVADPR